MCGERGRGCVRSLLGLLVVGGGQDGVRRLHLGLLVVVASRHKNYAISLYLHLVSGGRLLLEVRRETILRCQGS